MMESFLFVTSLLLRLAESCYGGVLLSSLPTTLLITASPQQGQVLKAGEDKITLNWGLNHSHEATDDLYENVKVALCYAPVSQVDRAWRRTEDDLSKDKSCQFTIVKRPYDASSVRNYSYEWVIEKEVPEATYFIRVYAYNSAGEAVAFGQTTDAKKSSNLFQVHAISGRHLSLEIASACFSAFSVVSLFGFFLVERSKNKGSSKH